MISLEGGPHFFILLSVSCTTRIWAGRPTLARESLTVSPRCGHPRRQLRFSCYAISQKLFFFFLFYKALMIWCPSEIMFSYIGHGKKYVDYHTSSSYIDDFLLSLVIQQTDIRKSLWQWNHGNVYTVTVWPNYFQNTRKHSNLTYILF